MDSGPNKSLIIILDTLYLASPEMAEAVYLAMAQSAGVRSSGSRTISSTEFLPPQFG